MLLQKLSVVTLLWQMRLAAPGDGVLGSGFLNITLNLPLHRYLRSRVHYVVGVEDPFHVPHQFDLSFA